MYCSFDESGQVISRGYVVYWWVFDRLSRVRNTLMYFFFREFTAKELAMYNRINNLDPVIIPILSTKVTKALV